MNVSRATLEKMQELPEWMIEEVDDFVAFLLTRRDAARWQLWKLFTEILQIGESGMADYLPNLREYEDRLARGEVKW